MGKNSRSLFGYPDVTTVTCPHGHVYDVSTISTETLVFEHGTFADVDGERLWEGERKSTVHNKYCKRVREGRIAPCVEGHVTPDDDTADEESTVARYCSFCSGRGCMQCNFTGIE